MTPVSVPLGDLAVVRADAVRDAIRAGGGGAGIDRDDVRVVLGGVVRDDTCVCAVGDLAVVRADVVRDAVRAGEGGAGVDRDDIRAVVDGIVRDDT